MLTTSYTVARRLLLSVATRTAPTGQKETDMNLRTTLSALLAVFTLATASVAAAAPVPVRQDRQSVRIHQGVRSGELTRHEARRLAREQARIQRTKARFAVDGRISPREHRRLERMENRSSRHIFAAKHNRRVR